MNNENFNFENLTPEIRLIMKSEVNSDIQNDLLYFSTRFTSIGTQNYPDYLLQSIKEGNEATLANLLTNECYTSTERTKDGKLHRVNYKAANSNFSSGQFNHYYMRAVAIQAVELGVKPTIYRARNSLSPRQESIKKIGEEVDASALLEYLRSNTKYNNTIENYLQIPSGPNSGLSVKFDIN